MSSMAQCDNRMLYIPELISYFGHFLDYPSLFACIQVSRLWYNALLPVLYETLDDTKGKWPKILNSGNILYGWTESAVRDVIFQKHGSLIRHLYIHWAVINSAAGSAEMVNRLESIECSSIIRADCLNDQKYSRHNISDWDTIEPILSPTLFGDRTFRTMVYRRHALSQQIWITFQRFWMLVNNNKATLKRLRLDVTVGQAVSLEPLYKILASCSNLIYLENNYQPMDFQRLLECLPKLKSFTSNFSFLNRALLTKDMPQLRKLTLRHLVPTLSLIAMIKHLVNLEQLYIGWKITHFEESEPILGKTKSRIRGLHFLKHSFKDGDLFLVYSILPWMPELRELTVSHLAMHTAFAIATYCPLFESFTQVVLSSSLHPNYCMKTDPNSVAILLQNCRHLKHINAIQHAITAEHLDSAPEWVCNSSLKTFRVQIRGITRLLTSEEMVDSQAAYVNSLIDRPNTPAQEHALQVLNKSRDQHHRIYSRLSHLTALTVLDLGMEFRHIDVYRSKNPPYYKVGAKRYIDYGDPFPDTLELSLKSGLSQLETLKNLEVFGFEGCDHRMEREEMEWMVKAWPRLREIRGLQKVKMHALQRDIPTERLARHMARLKPSVKQ